MKKTQAKTPNRPPGAQANSAAADAAVDISAAVGAVAQAIAAIDVEDVAQYKLDDIAERIGNIADAIYKLSSTADKLIVAQYGSDADREKLVNHLKKEHYDIFE